LKNDISQALCGHPILTPAPLRNGSRRFRRGSALRSTRHLGRDAIGLEGKAVALGAGCKEPRGQDAGFTILDGNADDDRASLERSQSEADMLHRS
jgi:hypothetical protein